MGEAEMKKGITRSGGSKVKIDVLQCQKEIALGTFSDQDRQTLDRMLPGIYDSLVKRSAKSAALSKASDLPVRDGPNTTGG
jgi:hypothetical protein